MIVFLSIFAIATVFLDITEATARSSSARSRGAHARFLHPERARPRRRGGYDDPVAAQTVLVVEDEEAIAEAVRARLQSEGYQVVVASDGPEAHPQHAEHRPDLVVLDLMLPGMDGLEVCKRIQRDGWTPVLMLTAKTEEADKVAGFAVGADDYLTKPFSLRELAVRVQAILRRRERIEDTPDGRTDRARRARGRREAPPRRGGRDGDPAHAARVRDPPHASLASPVSCSPAIS